MKKNTKIDFTGLDAEIDIDAAKSYVQHRINIGKPLTQRAFDQAMNKALQAFQVGMTPTELVDWTVDKGWQGINIAYTKNALEQERRAMASTNNKSNDLDNWINGNVVEINHARIGQNRIS